MRESGAVSAEGVGEALKKVVSAKRADMLEINMKALETGYNYEA